MGCMVYGWNCFTKPLESASFGLGRLVYNWMGAIDSVVDYFCLDCSINNSSL